VGTVIALAACRQLLGIDVPVRDDAGPSLVRDTRSADSTGLADARPDGAAPACDPAACSAAGGTCMGDVCAITAPAGPAGVQCPDGELCDISCDDQGSCPTINCKHAAGCIISCDANNSCAGAEIDCGGPGGCTMYCKGGDTCVNDDFVCPNTGTGCDVECCGIGACSNNSGNATMHEPGTCP
jgi:hypothetical protein